mgnify:CR=1 FL=1
MLAEQSNKQSKEQEAEDGLRESLQEVLVVAEKLKPFCRSVDELLVMVQAALVDNGSGQLRLVGRLIFGDKK